MSDTTIRFLGRTDVGQRRKHNEDAFHASEDDHYCMLADGMGGRMFGEVAANMAVDLLRERFETFFPQSLRSLRSSEQQHVADVDLGELLRQGHAHLAHRVGLSDDAAVQGGRNVQGRRKIHGNDSIGLIDTDISS